MLKNKIFAGGVEVDDNGWYIFGRGDTERKRLWSKEHTLHPAKMPIPLFLAILEYVSEPGDTILDPFGGVGTTALATLYGRRVLLCEVEDSFADIAQAAYDSWPEPKEKLFIIRGDNRRTLPLTCDHVITSPPYAQTMVGGKNTKLAKDLYGDTSLAQYQSKATNIGNLNPYFYSKAMDDIYGKLVQGVKPGGTITVVIKDQMQAGERIILSQPCMKSFATLGWSIENWWKHKPVASGFANIQRSKGNEVVYEEDIIQFKRKDEL